jgi:hypothetical protein
MKVLTRNIPSQCIFSCKVPTAIVTTVISLFHVDTLVVSLQICLSHKLLIAVLQGTGKRIFSTCVVGLHMSFEVVASPKQLPATFDMALEVGIFLSCEFSNSGTRWSTTVIE